MTPRVRLIVAAALFFGWLAWLGVTALTKSRTPAVSHAQAAGADAAVVAELKADADGMPATAKVTEVLTAGGPAAGAVVVENLPKAKGFAGDGKYLLLLSKTGSGYRLTGQQRSPGADLDGVGPPLIYSWNDTTDADLRKQVKALFP